MKSNPKSKSSKPVSKPKQLIIPPASVPASDREMPAGMELSVFTDIVQSVMSKAQFDVINGHTPAYAIKTRAGGAGAIFRYVPHGYVRAKLNQAFGFDYDFKVLPNFAGMPYQIMERVEKKDEKSVQYLVVLGELTIRLRDPRDIRKIITTIVKQDFGSQAWRASMELGDALKAASSDALKRCGLGLGIALDLYFDDGLASDHWTRQQMQRVNRTLKPTEPLELLSRAVSELEMDADAIEACCGVSVAVLMDMNVEEVTALWDKLKEYKKGETK